MKAPIGIFDSGVGGLTVMKEMMRQLPNENLIYFGDTARVPYGSKSEDTIIRYSRQNIRFLLSKNVKAIVVACNTASALALDEIKGEFDIPIVGVVEPGAKTASETTQNHHIGIIGTEATVRSCVYNHYLRRINADITVVSKACPLFVPLVEEGFIEDRITDAVVSRYLSELKDYDIDTLILGCTHYPLISNTIKRYMGNKVKLVNPAYETAKSLKSLLKQQELLNIELAQVTYEYYVSDIADKFTTFANSVLPFGVKKTTVINIEKF